MAVRFPTAETGQAEEFRAAVPAVWGHLLVGNRRTSGAGEFERIVLTAVDSRYRPLWNRPLAGTKATAALPVDDGRDGFVIAGFARLPGGWGETALLIRLDPQGHELWRRVFPGAGHTRAWALASRPRGGWLLTGDTRQRSDAPSDLWLAATDADGVRLWEHRFGGPGKDAGRALAVVPDGSIVVAGYRQGQDRGDIDGWLLVLTADGRPRWERTVGDPDLQEAFFTLTPNGADLVAAGQQGRPGAASAVLAAAFGADGSARWQKCYQGAGASMVFAARALEDGGVVLAGETVSLPQKNHQVLLLQIDRRGSLRSWRTPGGRNWERALALTGARDGSLLVAGFVESAKPAGFKPLLMTIDRLARSSH
jgi:outer membrane protein assembly factor BamB